MQTNSFIEAIIECTQMKREAIFAAELTFDENGLAFDVVYLKKNFVKDKVIVLFLFRNLQTSLLCIRQKTSICQQ